MKCFSMRDEPIKVFGIPNFYKTGIAERYPESLLKYMVRSEVMPGLRVRCPGARVCFKTNSAEFKIEVTIAKNEVDVGMSIYACLSAAVLIGGRGSARFAGLVNPNDYTQLTFEKTFHKEEMLEDITIFFPRNVPVVDIKVYVADGAEVLPPTPYKPIKPMLFYGSSITEGAHASNPFCTYTSLLSDRFNVDYYNMGFSGSAKGELELADYFNTLDFSVFIYDYDHNSPTPEELEKTHEPFFKRIREKHPLVPVIMMSKPKEIYYDYDKKRRDIIYKTYLNAKNSGDENVYFIDGDLFFGSSERYLCSSDTIHPNDLGFYRMANVIEPVLREIIEKLGI